LNDISEGGCSFISLEPLHSFIRNGNELENSVLNLGEYGQILVNLKIKHISEKIIANNVMQQASEYLACFITKVKKKRGR
jgi:hypothetical protein